MLRALASAAGSAVKNARLYEEVRRRKRQLVVTVELRTEMLSGGKMSDALQLIAQRAAELANADADAAMVLIADDAIRDLRMSIFDLRVAAPSSSNEVNIRQCSSGRVERRSRHNSTPLPSGA